MTKIVVVLFFVISSLKLAAYEPEPMIFNEKRDSNWLPITYIVNGSLDVIQNPYWFSQEDFFDKTSIVWNRVKNPDKSIRRDGGYGKFIRDEFFTLRVLPNVGLHFLGGAYDTLWMTQYYEHHDVPFPEIWAMATTYLARFGNEVSEVSSDEISSHDHIADLYIFDIAGFFLAYNKPAMNFLVRDMGMEAWHFNVMYSEDGDNFFNAGLNYIFRPKFAHMNGGKIRPMYYLGMQTLIGSSFDYGQKSTFSLAMGLSPTDPLEQKGRFVTGLFHERNGQLEASLFINGSEDYRWRLNLYDALFGRFDSLPEYLHLSVMVGEQKNNNYAVGINLNLPFGLGSNQL